MICKAECLIIWEKTGFEFSLNVLSYKLMELDGIIFNDASICSDLLRFGYAPEPINPSDYKIDIDNMLYYYFVDMDSKILPDNIEYVINYVKQIERNEVLDKLL